MDVKLVQQHLQIFANGSKRGVVQRPNMFELPNDPVNSLPESLVFPLQSLSDLDHDGSLNEPRLAAAVGAQSRDDAAALKVPHSRVVLAYVPASSNP